MTCREPGGCPFPDQCTACDCRSFREAADVPDVAGGDIARSHARRGSQDSPHAAETILEEAQRLVYGDRQSEYGPGHVEMAQVAQMWTVVIGAPVSAYQAALCMTALKLVRARNGHKRDSLVDGAGYLALAQRVVDGL